MPLGPTLGLQIRFVLEPPSAPKILKDDRDPGGKDLLESVSIEFALNG